MAPTAKAYKYVAPTKDAQGNESYDPQAMGLPSWIKSTNVKTTSDGRIAILDTSGKTPTRIIAQQGQDGSLQKVGIDTWDATTKGFNTFGGQTKEQYQAAKQPAQSVQSTQPQSIEDIVKGIPVGTVLGKGDKMAPVLDFNTFKNDLRAQQSDIDTHGSATANTTNTFAASRSALGLQGVGEFGIDIFQSPTDISKFGHNESHYYESDSGGYSQDEFVYNPGQSAMTVQEAKFNDPNTIYHIQAMGIGSNGQTGSTDKSLSNIFYKAVGDKLVPLQRRDDKVEFKNDSFGDYLKDAAIGWSGALNFVPGLGTAIGTYLGATGMAASVVGGAVIGAGTSALTGGNALTGAITGGLGGSTAGLTSALTPALGDSASLIAKAAIAGAKTAVTGGGLAGFATSFASSALPSMAGGLTDNADLSKVISAGTKVALPMLLNKRHG